MKERFKRNAGRPSAASLGHQFSRFKKLVDKYFATQDAENKPYTVSGLALMLGLSREKLLNFEPTNKKDKKTPALLQQALLRIEEYYESNCFKLKNVTGVLFLLKNNFGYRNEENIINTGTQDLNIKLDFQFDEDYKEPTPPTQQDIEEDINFNDLNEEDN